MTDVSDQAPTEFFNVVAEYFSMLSAPSRLRIIHALCGGERSVTEIIEHTGLTQSNVSQSLGLMYRAGLLARRREGTQVLYSVQDQRMLDICRYACVSVASSDDRFLDDVAHTFPATPTGS